MSFQPRNHTSLPFAKLGAWAGVWFFPDIVWGGKISRLR